VNPENSNLVATLTLANGNTWSNFPPQNMHGKVVQARNSGGYLVVDIY